MKTIITILLVGASILSGAQSLSQGLMAQYCLNGNADDASGNLYHGFSYGATPTTDRLGQTNAAMLFDGVDDYIVIEDYLIPNSSFSFSFWAKSEQWKSHIAFWVENTSNNDRISGSVNYKHRTYNTIFWDLGGVTPPYRLEDLYKTYSSNWEHYVMVYDAVKDSTYCYLNGTLHMAESLNITIDASNRKLYLGSGNFANYFNGKLDDFRVYDRPVTAIEAGMLYNDKDMCTGGISGIYEQKKVITVYPNPTSDKLYIEDLAQNTGYTITDAIGRVVLKGRTSKTIDVEMLESGVYYLQIAGLVSGKFIRL